MPDQNSATFAIDTGMMPPSNTINVEDTEINRANAEWRIRLHRQLDALCDDAEARRGFNGSVTFEIIWRGRRLDRFETNISQTVTK